VGMNALVRGLGRGRWLAPNSAELCSTHPLGGVEGVFGCREGDTQDPWAESKPECGRVKQRRRQPQCKLEGRRTGWEGSVRMAVMDGWRREEEQAPEANRRISGSSEDIRGRPRSLIITSSGRRGLPGIGPLLNPATHIPLPIALSRLMDAPHTGGGPAWRSKEGAEWKRSSPLKRPSP